jgi:hypothetical protein
MSLQQAGPGIRSLVTFRNSGFCARYRRSRNIFRGFPAVCRSSGQVRAAAKYRADGDPMAIMGWRGATRFPDGDVSVSSPPWSFVKTA